MYYQQCDNKALLNHHKTVIIPTFTTTLSNKGTVFDHRNNTFTNFNC